MRRSALTAAAVLFFSTRAMGFWDVGHRGVRHIGDENTIAAMDTAVERGANAVEFDVRMTQDGALVIMHDPSVNRTTDGKGKVSRMMLEEFKALDAGHGHHPPTLREVLDHFHDSDVTLFIEVKEPKDAVMDALAPMLAGYDGSAHLIAFATSASFLSELKKRAPNVKAFYAPLLPFSPEKVAKKHGLDGLLVADFYLSPWLVRRAHALGLPVVASMIAHKYDLDYALGLGVDGALVNDPAVLAHDGGG